LVVERKRLVPGRAGTNTVRCRDRRAIRRLETTRPPLHSHLTERTETMKFSSACKIHKACAKAGSRYAMNHVRFEGGNLIATDGRMLAIVPVEDAEEDAEGFIPKEAFNDACKVRPEARIDANGTVEVHTRLGRVSMARPEEGEFPRFEAIMRDTATDAASVTLNDRMLWDLAQALGAGDENNCVTLSIRDKTSPVIVETRNGSGAIMPVAKG